MTDREKLTAVVAATCDRWRETLNSLIIYDSATKIIFTAEGEIKSVIRDRKSFGPDGKNGHAVGVHEDGGL